MTDVYLPEKGVLKRIKFIDLEVKMTNINGVGTT
jgi:hypothetical protein